MLGLRLARAVSGPRRVLGSRRAALVAVPTRTFAKDTSAEHTPAEVFEAALASAPVVVFSRSWCPFCKQLAVLFEEVMPLDLRVAHIVDLESRPDGDAIQDYIAEIEGSRSVPKVYISGEFVGGCDDTLGLHRDKELEPMIQKAIMKAFMDAGSA